MTEAGEVIVSSSEVK